MLLFFFPFLVRVWSSQAFTCQVQMPVRLPTINLLSFYQIKVGRIAPNHRQPISESQWWCPHPHPPRWFVAVVTVQVPLQLLCLPLWLSVSILGWRNWSLFCSASVESEWHWRRTARNGLSWEVATCFSSTQSQNLMNPLILSGWTICSIHMELVCVDMRYTAK